MEDEKISIIPPPHRIEAEPKPGEVVFTNLPPVTYEDRVGSVLLDLPIDGIFELAKNVKTENREKFIAAVKEYIDRDFGKQDGFEVYFNNDYSKIKKKYYYAHSHNNLGTVKKD